MLLFYYNSSEPGKTISYKGDIIVIIIISSLFSVDLKIAFTKQYKANSRQPQM